MPHFSLKGQKSSREEFSCKSITYFNVVTKHPITDLFLGMLVSREISLFLSFQPSELYKMISQTSCYIASGFRLVIGCFWMYCKYSIGFVQHTVTEGL